MLQEDSTLDEALKLQKKEQAGVKQNCELESLDGNRIKESLEGKAMVKMADPGLGFEGELESNLGERLKSLT